MKNCILCVFVLIICGCVATPKFESLKKAQDDSYFILEKDVYTELTSGLLNVFSAMGLQAGRYDAVAEDSNGVYYACEKACLFNLLEDDARKYIESGEMPETKLGPTRGGLWFPKKGVKKEVKLFNIIDSIDFGNLGLLGNQIIADEKGRIGFLELIGNLSILKDVKIIYSGNDLTKLNATNN